LQKKGEEEDADKSSYGSDYFNFGRGMFAGNEEGILSRREAQGRAQL
jgi:hypothetical protein